MKRLPGHFCLALMVIATWTASLHDGFVNFDTPWMVVDNHLLDEGLLSATVAVLWDMSFATRHALGAEYLPIRDLSVLLDLSLWPTNYLAQHVHNLVLYVLVCALVLELMIALLGLEIRAWCVAAVFALHPVQTETIAWLVGRKDLLAGIFVVAGVVLWLRADGRVRNLALSVLCMMLACWSKSTAIVFPGLLLLLSLFGQGARRQQHRGVLWLALIAGAAVVAATSMAVGQQMGFLAERRGEGLLELMWVQCWMFSHYLLSFAWPVELSVLYAEPSVPVRFGAADFGPVFLCLVIVVAVLLAWRPRPLVALGLSWFVIAQLPTSQLVPLQNLVADRYLFLPSMGLVLALGALLPVGRFGAHKTLWVGMALLLIILGLQSRQRCEVWQDSVQLWTDVASRNPDLGRGHAALAGALWAAGREGEAATVIEQALSRLPRDPMLLESSGLQLMRQGRDEEAERAFRSALRGDPRLRRAANNLALLLHRLQRSAEAQDLASQMVRTHPSYAHGLNTLGTILFDLGQLEEAERAFLSSLEVNPRGVNAVCNLGSVAFRAGELEAAVSWWQRCLSLEPSHSIAAEGLAHIRASSLERGAR